MRHDASESGRADPAVYGVAEGSWTAGEIDDLVQDVTTEQLLKQAQLDYIIDVASSIDDVRRLLRHHARRALIRRRRRTVVDQLLDRLKALLGADGYEAVAGISPARYQPTGSDFGPRVPRETALDAAAAAVRLLPTSSGSGGRAPAVFRTEVLEQVLSNKAASSGNARQWSAVWCHQTSPSCNRQSSGGPYVSRTGRWRSAMIASASASAGTSASRKFGCRSPLLDEFCEQYGPSEVLGHDPHDIVDPGRRG